MTDHHESQTDHDSHEQHSDEEEPKTSQTDKPSQAEGEDPGHTGSTHEVIPAEGKPSQADA